MFNAKVTKEKMGDQNFSMMHLNIRSVKKTLAHWRESCNPES